MRVAAYTGGVMVPSARARVRQYIDPLDRLRHHGAGIPSALGKHTAPAPSRLRPLWMAATAVVAHGDSHLLLEGRRDLDIPPVATRLCTSPGHGEAADDPGRR